MRIAFAISANECNARSIAIQWRQIAPSCGLTFRLSILVSLSPAPLLVAICVVQWSALVLTALQSPCFRFVRRSAPTMRLGFAIWMNPSQAPGTSPSGWKCCRSPPPPHAHPIPGVPGIPPRALPEPAHISSNKVKRSQAWPLPANQLAIRPYRHLRRLSSGTYLMRFIWKWYFETRAPSRLFS